VRVFAIFEGKERERPVQTGVTSNATFETHILAISTQATRLMVFVVERER
jgi:hypothetical protein